MDFGFSDKVRVFLNGKPRAYLNVCMHHGGR